MLVDLGGGSDDQRVRYVDDGVVPADSTELALLAVDNCPEFAIGVEDTDD